MGDITPAYPTLFFFRGRRGYRDLSSRHRALARRSSQLNMCDSSRFVVALTIFWWPLNGSAGSIVKCMAPLWRARSRWYTLIHHPRGEHRAEAVVPISNCYGIRGVDLAGEWSWGGPWVFIMNGAGSSTCSLGVEFGVALVSRAGAPSSGAT